MNLREALKQARALGLTVGPVFRTGEVVVSDGSYRVRVNSRRKDCPAILEAFLRKKRKSA